MANLLAYFVTSSRALCFRPAGGSKRNILREGGGAALGAEVEGGQVRGLDGGVLVSTEQEGLKEGGPILGGLGGGGAALRGLEGGGALLRGAEVEGGQVRGLSGGVLEGPEGGGAALGGLERGGVLLQDA